jgi:hypothetical protein
VGGNIKLRIAAALSEMGDVSASGNKLLFSLDDTNITAIITQTGTRMMDLNHVALQYQLGDIDAKGNGSFLAIIDGTSNAAFNNMSITTGSPSGIIIAPGSWELGAITVAASVLDATQYLTVVLYKLALAV